MTLHHHQYRLHFSEGFTRMESIVEKGAGHRHFIEVELPITQRYCQCGLVESLQLGNWRPAKGLLP